MLDHMTEPHTSDTLSSSSGSLVWSSPTPAPCASNFSAAQNDTHALLRQLSDQRALQLLPVFVLLGLAMLLGVIGNCLIVHVYLSKFKASRSRTAIVALGVLDLISCTLGIPGEVADLRFSFDYHSDFLCRASRTLATFPNIASGIMLLAVAFDRYRIICLPLRTSVAAVRTSARRHVICACAASLLLTWPAALVYGTKNTATGVAGVMGRECSSSELVAGTRYHLVYSSVLSVVFLTTFIVMSVFYFLIGRQVYRQGEFRKTLMQLRSGRRKNTLSELEASGASEPEAGGEVSNGDCTPSGVSSPPEPTVDRAQSACASQDKNMLECESPASPPLSPVSGLFALPPLSPTAALASRRKFNRSASSILRRMRSITSGDPSVNSRTRKTTFMLCLISIVFVLSYLPHLVVKIGRALSKDHFLADDSSTSLVLYNLCVRSYFLNNFANIFVYGFCSFRFRQECCRLLRRLFPWKTCSKKFWTCKSTVCSKRTYAEP